MVARQGGPVQGSGSCWPSAPPWGSASGPLGPARRGLESWSSSSGWRLPRGDAPPFGIRALRGDFSVLRRTWRVITLYGVLAVWCPVSAISRPLLTHGRRPGTPHRIHRAGSSRRLAVASPWLKRPGLSPPRWRGRGRAGSGARPRPYPPAAITSASSWGPYGSSARWSVQRPTASSSRRTPTTACRPWPPPAAGRGLRCLGLARRHRAAPSRRRSTATTTCRPHLRLVGPACGARHRDGGRSIRAGNRGHAHPGSRLASFVALSGKSSRPCSSRGCCSASCPGRCSSWAARSSCSGSSASSSASGASRSARTHVSTSLTARPGSVCEAIRLTTDAGAVTAPAIGSYEGPEVRGQWAAQPDLRAE